MNQGLRTNKAFTLIELVVAVALMVMILSFSSVIFKGSIGAHRVAGANAEIMQKLRAITDQLNADFKGLRADAPLLIWFRQDKDNPAQRYDEIMFFADGDFHSTQLYESSSVTSNREPIRIDEEPQSAAYKLVRGNVARIQYAHSSEPWNQRGSERTLARRQHILSADSDLEEWPEADNVEETFDDESTGGYKNNELYEHDSLSLAQWKVIRGDITPNPYDSILYTCIQIRPGIDMFDPTTFHKLMCNGVDSFGIQWSYWDWDDGELRWYPSDDPDGNGNDNDSHFDLIGNNEDRFGILFNIPGGYDGQYTEPPEEWFYPITDAEYNSGDSFSSRFYPEALKFTFRLYDSKGVIKDGREFTHIVYIGD